MIKRYLLKFFCNHQPENNQTILEQLNLSLFLILVYQLALDNFLYPKTFLIISVHNIKGSYILP